jgi:acyl-CoA reductase-like NAD-dependent aldehyde dehydrogenase
VKVINPANETVIRELEEDTPASIAAKYESARKSQKAWAAVPLSERLKVVRRFRDRLVFQREKLSVLLTSEVGKPISQSRNELNGVLTRVDFFLENMAKVLEEESVHSSEGLDERISFDPLGVIGNISAWNYPYFVGSNVFVPARLAGNAVLYKPSEYASLSGMAITDLLHQSGVPKEVFAPIIGGGAAGAEMLKHPLNGVFFTGSYATGKKINQAASQHLMKVQLELGGKDPVYVCEDVDVKVAAESLADGAFYNTGQSCCSVERIYVHARVHDAFVDAFMNTVKGFAAGDPMQEKTYLGAMTRGQHLEFLEAQVRDAIDKGAKLLSGGKRLPGPGYYFAPTVFTEVSHSMDIMREETFGPLIGIQRVRDDAEAVALMNDTPYGLTAGVYTRSKERARKILSEVNAGSAYWNCCDRVSPRLPWSGRGNSGLGSTLSKYGILAFVQPKAWHLKG